MKTRNLTSQREVSLLTARLLSPRVMAKKAIKSLLSLAIEAILIIFLRYTILFEGKANKISVVVQYCTSLNFLSRISKLEGILPGN